MTLKYFLFGNPQNKLEFDDMLFRKKIESIDISAEEIVGNYHMRDRVYGRFYCCFPILEVADKELKLLDRRISDFVDDASKNGKKNILHMRKKVLNDMIKMARDYEKTEIKVTMAGREIEEAVEEYKQYHKDELKKLFTLYPHPYL